jgi:hypothetical protein
MTGARSAALQALLRGLAALAIAASAVTAASHPRWRVEADMTRTRAYALSDRSTKLLKSLDGEWSITIAAAGSALAPGTQRQIDEVLRRFAEAAPTLRTARIDPTDPAALAEWERLVAQIIEAATRSERRSAHGPAGSAPREDGAEPHAAPEAVPARADRAAEALDEGERELDALEEFARREAAALAALPSSGSEEIDHTIASMQAGFAEYARRAGELRDVVRRLRSTSPQQPIPDEDAARAALAANHAAWTDQLTTASDFFRSLSLRPAVGEAHRALAARARESYEGRALALRRSQDRLSRLPASALSEYGRRLASGEAAVIIGPPGVVIVPAWQLLPAELPVDGTLPADAHGRTDRRFRGEQVLAAAIESLLQPMPMVVLLHAEDRSLLRTDASHNDLHAAAEVLRSGRVEVREWLASEPAPQLPTDRPVIHLVLPPQRRTGVELSPAERTLLDRTRRLVEEGSPILLTLGRSLRPLFRQEDPWAALCAVLGVEIDTGTVILELDRLGPGRGATRSWQRLEPPESPHPISAAIAGQGLVLTHTMPLRIADGARGAEGSESSGEPAILALVDPAERRWLESDWRLETQERASPPEGRELTEPIPVALALERSLSRTRAAAGGAPSARQRVVVVASGGWLLTSVLDLAEPLGGGRFIPANPGNRELLMASVLWLSGLDDQIAPGPLGASAARLAGVGTQERLAWGTLSLGVMPLAALGLGSIIVLLRRRA